ncbi:DUF1302 family protein [Desulfomicrobium salsuginis]
MLLVALAAMFLAATPLFPSARHVLSDLSLATENDALTLTIAASGAPRQTKHFSLTDPIRLVVDIAPAVLPGAPRTIPASHALVERVRAAQFDAQTVRVVFDLKQPVSHRLDIRQPAEGSAGRTLVFTLTAENGGTAQAESPATGQPGPAPAADSTAHNEKIVLLGESPATGSTAHNEKIVLLGESPVAERTRPDASGWGEASLSGFLMAKVAQELDEEKSPGQPRMFRNTVRVEGKWVPAGFFGGENAKTDAETAYLLGSVQSDYLSFGPDPASDEYDLDLFEAYLFRSTPDWDLRLGRQIVRWGKTDQISPVDNVNSQDMREFLIPDLEDRKLPNWMARLRAFIGQATLEAVFIPFFEPNEFDYTGNTWALLGTESVGLRVEESEPEGLDNADWGMRASLSQGGWDVAASYLRATEKTPHLDLDPFDPAGPTLHADYRRQNIFGAEFETTAGSFGFRGEAAYIDLQSFPTESLDSVSKSMVHTVLGVDYLGQDDWYANIQLSHQHIFGYETDILFLSRDNFFLNGEVNREFLRGNAKLKLRYAVDLTNGGAFLTPEAILTSVRDLELSLGTNLFFGPEDTLFGRYRDDSQVFLRATRFF